MCFHSCCGCDHPSVVDASQNENITDANGNIIDYSSNYENELAQLEEKESTPATIKDKIAVYENWKNANEQELLLKKIELNDAQGDDKVAIETRISELNDQIKSNEEYIALYTDKLPELVKLQTEAIKNIKIDKITVWDSGNGQSGDGNTTTANFVSGMMKTVPPLNDLFNMAGLNLPSYLKGNETQDASSTTSDSKPEEKKD